MMRVRTMMASLLAVTLVAGVVTASPAAMADDTPPIGADAPFGGDTDGDGTGGDAGGGDDGDPDDEGAGGADTDDGETDGGPENGTTDGSETEDGTEDDGSGGFGILSGGETIAPVTVPLHSRPALDFDFAEPRTLYGAVDFPIPADPDDWDSENETVQQRDTTVRSVFTADVDQDGLLDVISLVRVQSQPPMPVGTAFRSEGRAFLTPGMTDPAVGGWYVVVHRNTIAGLADGEAYPVGTETSGFFATLAVGDVDRQNGPDIVFSNVADQTIVTLLNDGTGTFTSVVTTSLDVGLDRGITLGDLDNDGFLDLVAPSNGASSTDDDDLLLIMRGHGDGTFLPGASIPWPDTASVALIDADKDGQPELLVTSQNPVTPASLWRWTDPGEGQDWSVGWSADTSAFEGLSAVAAWVGDFDDDGESDVVLLSRECASHGTDHCLISLLNDGGTFTQVSSRAAPYMAGHPSLVFPTFDGTMVDVDRDGHLDVLMPAVSGEVVVYFGASNGSFDDARVLAGASGWEPIEAGGWNAAGEYAYDWPNTAGMSMRAAAVTAVDVGGDGTMDIVVGSESGYHFSNSGDGIGRLSLITGSSTEPRSFAAAAAYPMADEELHASYPAFPPVMVDWTDDGHRDLVFAVPSTGISGSDVLLSRAVTGGFEPAELIGQIPSACAPLAVADVDKNGRLDVICAAGSAIHLALGGADGTLGSFDSIGSFATMDPKGESIQTLAVADVNNDGHPDVVVAIKTVVSPSYSGVAFAWLENLGSGASFAAPAVLQQSGVTYPEYQSDSSFQHRSVIADLTGDGHVDLAIAAKRGSSPGTFDVFIHVNDGGDADSAPSFTSYPILGVELEDYGLSLGTLDAGDVDGDGTVDLILTGITRISSGEYGGIVQLLLGDGDGTFTVGERFPLSAAWPGHRVADLNGDGHPDLISPTTYRGVELRAGNGDGTFAAPQVLGVPSAALGWVEVADVDRDGALDIVGVVTDAPAGTGQLAVLRNLGESSTDPGGGDPGCESGDENCDDDEDPSLPPTVNLVAHPPEWTPSTGSASDPLTAITRGTVTVTVENTGTAPATGPWIDSLWLSADEEWSTGDTLLEAIPRMEVLAAGESFTTTHDVILAPATAGDFHIVLKVDTRDEITEKSPAEDDNHAAAGPFTFDPPILEVPASSASGTGTPTTVTGPQAVVRIPEIESGTSAVRLAVTSVSEASPVDSFAVRDGRLPTATVASQRHNGPGSLTLVLGPERYVVLDLADGQSATVTATRIEFGIGSIAPKRVSVGGPVSFVLSGVQLSLVDSAWAVNPDGVELPQSRLIRHSSGDLTVTFDLTGQEPGTFDVQVAGAGQSATLAGAFTAVADRVGSVRTSVLIPETVRSGAVGEVWITFANDGLTDAVAPILRVRSRGVAPISGDSPYPMGLFYVSPSVPGAPVGVIPAGASGRIAIPFLVDSEGPNGLPASMATPAAGQYGFLVDEFGIDSLAPYNAIADFAEELATVDEADRSAVAMELVARFGETGGSYLAAMHRLREALTPPIADMDELRTKIFENAKEAVTTDAVHGILSTYAGAPLANRGMQIVVPDEPDEQRTIDILTDEYGNWSAPGIDGVSTAQVHVQGYGPGVVKNLVSPTAASPIDLQLPDWSSLTGTVTGLDGTFAADAVITVVSSDGTQWIRAVADTDGVYRFDGIRPGQHRLVVIGMDGGLASSDFTMPATATTRNVVLGSSGISADGGAVAGALPPMPITGLPAEVDPPTEVTVWVDDGGPLRPVEADDSGSFTIFGAPGSSATLWVFDTFLGVRSAEVTFPAAGNTADVEWDAGGFTVAVPVTLPDDNVLPQVYLQRAEMGGEVPTVGAGAGAMLIPSGYDGDPVTWTGGTSADASGMLSVANIPPGDYRVTAVYPDGGEDIAEFTIAGANHAVTFPSRPAMVTATGTATQSSSPIIGGLVELTSTSMDPARRYVAATGDPETDPPGTSGAWSVVVAWGEYDVTYFDAAGMPVASEVKSFTDGSPLRGSGHAFTAAVTGAPTALGASYPALSPLRTDGEYAPAGGSKAELEAVYKAKFEIGSTPPVDSMVGQALAMPYPNQPPPDECKALDTSWLAAAKVAANRAEATRQLIAELITDTRKTKAWMYGEAALRAVMFLGEISNFFLGVLSIKDAVGKAALTAKAREEAKTLAAQAIKPTVPTGGTITLGWQPILEKFKTISELSVTIYSNAKAAVYSADPASAQSVLGSIGEIANLLISLSKEIGMFAASTAAAAARELIGPISAVYNMRKQIREAGESYRSAIAQLDAMKSALDQLYISYEFDLGQAHQAWFDFQANRFPEISLDDCEGSGGGGDEDDEGGDGDDGPGDGEDGPGDGDGPSDGPKDPRGPKPGPKPTVGPNWGRPVSGIDPNEIVGPYGVGDDQWVQTGSVLGYRIGFENLGPGSLEIPEGLAPAEAPAAAVTIEFPLPDEALIDTVELGDFGFGVGSDEVRYEPEPGEETSFEDQRTWTMEIPAPYGEGPTDLALSAKAWLDRAARTVYWEISLTNPDTGFPHAYPDAGFLPPEPEDDPGAGQGWANISFATDAAAATGTTVTADARIVFDTNDPIDTNTWSNRLDGTAPTASVTAASTTVVGQTVTVGLNDSGGSGAGLVDVWRSVDGGPMHLWRYQVPPGPQVLLGTPGQTIGLAARSTDRVGNAEDAPSAPQFFTTLRAPSGGGSDDTGSGGSGSGGSGTSGGSGAGSGLPAEASRFAGADRYATSAALAEQFGSAPAVVLANGENAFGGADALAANYLAGQVGAPIVLTRANTLPPAAKAAIGSVLAGAGNVTIYVMGSVASVSDSVAQQAKSAAAGVVGGTVSVVRIGGSDRYETAAMAASNRGAVTNLISFGSGSPAHKTAILASGSVNADALAAGPLSFAWGIPVLLTGAGALADAARSVITAQGVTQLIVLGGVDRIPQSALDAAKAAGVTSIKRIAGPNRFATAAELYRFVTTEATDGSGEHYGAGIGGIVFVANGLSGFPDALAAGPLAGKSQSILLTVPGPTTADAVVTFLGQLKGRLEGLVALGGPTTVSDQAMGTAAGAIRGG